MRALIARRKGGKYDASLRGGARGKWKTSEGNGGRGIVAKRISDCIGFTYLAQLERERRALRVACLHVALQVDIKKLEHEVKLLIRVDNVQQSGIKIKIGRSRSHRRKRRE